MNVTVAPLEKVCWTVLAPVPPGGSVLWVGPARGDQFAQLVPIFGRVFDLDPRDATEGARVADNPVGPEAGADLAVLQPTLGDVRQWAPEARPRDAWEALLRTVYARLRPGGHVFVAAEARWKIARALRLGGAPRPCLASLREYRAVLAAAGFTVTHMWCAFPNCEDSKFLVECRQPVFDHFLRVLAPRPRSAERRVARRLLNGLGALKYWGRWYWILGRREMAAA